LFDPVFAENGRTLAAGSITANTFVERGCAFVGTQAVNRYCFNKS
jgi:hypothetical protein